MKIIVRVGWFKAKSKAFQALVCSQDLWGTLFGHEDSWLHGFTVLPNQLNRKYLWWRSRNRDVNAAGKPGTHLTALELCLQSQIGTIWIAPFVMGSYVYMQSPQAVGIRWNYGAVNAALKPAWFCKLNLKATIILAITLGLLGLEAKIGLLHSQHIITSSPGA